MTMQPQNYEKQMYMLKIQATNHLNNRKYSYAMVYLLDTLNYFDKVIDDGSITDQSQMEKLITQIKLPCHKNLTLCYLKQGNYENCIKHCQQVLNIESNNVKILYRLGISYINIGDLTKAEKYLRKAYLIEPNQKQVMKALQRIEAQKTKKAKISIMSNKSANTNPEGIQLTKIVKYLFLWPFLLMIFIYKSILGNKAQLK